MRRILIAVAVFAFINNAAKAQEIKESVQPLSAKAQNGHIYNVAKDDKGNTDIVFRMKLDKKSDVLSYEKYSFDKDLKFIAASDIKIDKQDKPDIERTYYNAYIGGITSFDVLSRKLKISKSVRLETWNYAKQKYKIKKSISSETIKPKNDNGKVYLGYASYFDDNNNVFIIAKIDGKDQADKFFALLFNDKLEIKEMPVELKGSYSLVYSDMLATDDVVMVFAPNKGEPDVSKYVYFQFDIKGKLKNKVEFKSPATALLLSTAYEKNGDIYFFGTSKKSSDPFTKVFNEYVPIYNPGSITAKMEGNNQLDVKWRESLEDKMDFFNLLKFTGDKLVFSSSTPIDEFKSKFKTAPGDKGASAYKGKKFFVESFYVAPSGDYLVAGQLTSSVHFGIENKFDAYGDIVCFHFSKEGNLKAQYGIGKVNNDKASEVYNLEQFFRLSADGKNLYWNLLEVEGDRDWYTGLPSAVYFPRITKIDLNNPSLGEVKTMGNEKYFLIGDLNIYDEKENSATFIGGDEKGKNLWVGKVVYK